MFDSLGFFCLLKCLTANVSFDVILQVCVTVTLDCSYQSQRTSISVYRQSFSNEKTLEIKELSYSKK